MKTKKLLVFGFGITLSLAALLFVNKGQAFAATKTWDGGGVNNNMTTAANWNADSAPTAGDDLVFPVGVEDSSITNDFTAATSFNSISFTGDGVQTSYTISGNSMTIVAGINSTITGVTTFETISAPLIFNSDQSITVSSASNIYLEGIISGSGVLTKAGTGVLALEADNTFTGALIVSAGQVVAKQPAALGNSSAGTTIQNGAQLWYEMADTEDKNATIAEPLTINGSVFSSNFGALVVSATCGQSICTDSSITLSGAIVLGADVQVSKAGTVTITGALSGAHTITVHSGDSLTLIINSSNNSSQTPNGTYGAPPTTITYADNSPGTAISVGKNQTAIVTGIYAEANVSNGGILKGTGTITGSLRVYTGSHVAPGLSPGCLTVGSLQIYGGTFDAELGGTTACSGYDQIKVNGTVYLYNGSDIASLNTSIYGTFAPAVGNTFTIIDNDSSDAINGTFLNLAEGATFTVGGVVFRISYVGGDGNDVVLTTLSVPAAPDTGFGLITSNPLVALGVTSALAAGIYVLHRKQKLLFNK